MDLCPSLLTERHFLVCRERVSLPKAWRRQELAGWQIAFPEQFTTCELIDADGTLLGWFLGEAIAPAQKIWISEAVRLESGPDSNGPIAALESFLDGLTGRFAVVLLHAKFRRIYLDAGGFLPVVYSPSLGMSATTSALIPEGIGHQRHDCLSDALHIKQSKLWFPFGLTPRADVFRLLPNHYLDLDSMQPVRHWPKEKPMADLGLGSLLRSMADWLRSSYSTVAQRGKVLLSLTAGRDSRMLLAAARPFIQDTRCFTFSPRMDGDQLDTEVAKGFARRFHFDHLVLPLANEDAGEIGRYFVESSHSVTKAPFVKAKPLQHWSKHHTVVLGLAAEVGRAYYWNRSDMEGAPLSNLRILQKLNMPAVDPLPEAAQRYLNETLPYGKIAALDLLYVEQRLGCWGGPASSPLKYHGAMIPLFSSRELFSRMFKLPARYRFGQLLARDLILMQWPELLDIAFNGGKERRSP